MRTIRSVITTIIFLALLIVPITSAFADSATHYNLQLENVTIPWLFPPPDGLTSFCSEVPEGIHINPDDLGSDRVKQVSLTEMAGGAKRITVNDLITGTASDNYGSTYKFVYENNATYDYDGSIVTVEMKDIFKLKGGNADFIIGFNWRWAYEADSLEVLQVVENGQTVALEVNPNFFATADGVNEDPNIMPGSWQQLSTRGDPFNCDPL